MEPWRRLALYVLLFGLVGTAAELILLGHYEDRLQWTPLVLLAAGFAAGVATGVRPTRPAVMTFGTLMGLYLPTGALGVYLHLKSNVEFELEMRPSMHGWELVRETLRGAIPALAPGAMAYLGLLGLLVCLRHPSLTRRRPERDPPFKQE